MAYRRGDNDRPEVLGHGFIKAITWGQNMSREAMQMALEALEILTDGYDGTEVGVEIDAITALRQALEEKREPVGYFSVNDYGRWEENEGTYGEPLYTAPPKREWVGLTEPELHEINPTWPAPGQHWDYEDVLAFARAVEAKLKEKNT